MFLYMLKFTLGNTIETGIQFLYIFFTEMFTKIISLEVPHQHFILKLFYHAKDWSTKKTWSLQYISTETVKNR